MRYENKIRYELMGWRTACYAPPNFIGTLKKTIFELGKNKFL